MLKAEEIVSTLDSLCLVDLVHEVFKTSVTLSISISMVVEVINERLLLVEFYFRKTLISFIHVAAL